MASNTLELMSAMRWSLILKTTVLGWFVRIRSRRILKSFLSIIAIDGSRTDLRKHSSLQGATCAAAERVIFRSRVHSSTCARSVILRVRGCNKVTNASCFRIMQECVGQLAPTNGQAALEFAAAHWGSRSSGPWELANRYEIGKGYLRWCTVSSACFPTLISDNSRLSAASRHHLPQVWQYDTLQWRRVVTKGWVLSRIALTHGAILVDNINFSTF